MHGRLTVKQEEIVQFARRGHNFLITGQAEFGKSEEVRSLLKDCQQHNRKVRSSDMIQWCSCNCPFLLWISGTADLLWKQVVERVAGNVKVREKLRQVDVSIIMGRGKHVKCMDIVNALHHHSLWKFAKSDYHSRANR